MTSFRKRNCENSLFTNVYRQFLSDHNETSGGDIPYHGLFGKVALKRVGVPSYWAERVAK